MKNEDVKIRNNEHGIRRMVLRVSRFSRSSSSPPQIIVFLYSRETGKVKVMVSKFAGCSFITLITIKSLVIYK